LISFITFLSLAEEEVLSLDDDENSPTARKEEPVGFFVKKKFPRV
jgi:hypothetical protein